MTLVGYLLAVLNLLAAGAFLYLALLDYGVRQTWSYAVYRYELALSGLPVDKEDRDEKGQPRYLNMNDDLRRELTGSDKIETQEDALEARRAEIQRRIDDPSIKSSLPLAGDKLPKYVELLLPLARDVPEREALWSARDPNQLADQLHKYFDKAKATKDRDEKRHAIARLLVAFVDALPNDDEKTQRKAEASKPIKERADPTADRTYQQMLGVVGTRAAAIALDEQAQALLDMSIDLQVSRDEARRRFADAHDARLRELEILDGRLLVERDLLEAKKKAAMQAETLAAAQKKEKDKLEKELNDQRAITAAQLDRLTEKQNELFKVRVLLRDANRINQQLEQDIRSLERKTAKR
jgi:hypothetical protein